MSLSTNHSAAEEMGDIEWKEPYWHKAEWPGQLEQSIKDQLCTEKFSTVTGHSRFNIIAKREDCDDIIIELPSGEIVIAHLAWNSSRFTARRLRAFESLQQYWLDKMAEIIEHHNK